ncbi:MAG TPA: glycosyl hydrolase [Micromonosporaceae bacterium]
MALAVAGTFLTPPALASSGTASRSDERKLTEDAKGNYEALESADQYAEARSAPGDTIDAAAYLAARTAAGALPTVGGAWQEVTSKPYDSDAHGYRDPVWSNSGGGSGLVGGRVTALAADGSTLYMGAADGGVWKSTDGGTTWAPLTDDAATLSIGALAVDPADHSLWVGTGESNTSSDGYAGIGVLRSTDGGATFHRVGGAELNNALVSRVVFDGQGNVYLATSVGLYKRSASDVTSPWTLVLKPCVGQADTTFISDVAVRPGTHGRTVVAVVGWRGGSACNGFYVSNDGGASFTRTTATGSINDAQIGRTTLAYSADGAKLYALVESSTLFNHPSANQGGTTLMGLFAASGGTPAGPWNTIAETGKLADSGSALQASRGYSPGVQSWYNQFLAVDPADSNHIYLGLEEVYETTDGGSTWTTIAPYWNFGLPCAKNGLDACPPTPHSDQHAVMITDGRVYIGNDGGVYSRALRNATGWTDHNATLRTLQYYFAGAGRLPAGGTAIWGGLQDNGVSLLLPGSSTMVSPFGGDGGDVIVDPNNADRAVVEYTGLDMALTTNGGRSDGTVPSFREMTPSCYAYTYTPSPCDPNPRFIAPFRADPDNVNHWVAGGRYVWDNGGKGWDTTCSGTSCDWTIVHDTGAGHSITAIAVKGGVTYVGWCGPCNAPGFEAGIDTNAGGTWHRISAPNLPNRFINALVIDPANASHVYAVYNGFSRRWTDDAGYGHVFESTDAGATWTDISGNLPDTPSDDLVVANGKLVLGTDVGVFVAAAGGGAGTTWSRLGTALPNASVNDLTVTPDGAILAATHGRGIWQITLS